MKVSELRDRSGLTNEGIAKKLKISVNTVKSWRTRFKDVIPEEYMDLVKKIKMSKAPTKKKKRVGGRPKKATVKKKRVGGRPKKAISTEDHKTLVDNMVFDLFLVLKGDDSTNGLAEVKTTIEKYVKEKWQLK